MEVKHTITDANTLRDKSLTIKALQMIITGHLSEIKKNIDDAYRNKEIKIQYPIEYIFNDDVPNMDNENARIIVFSTIIETLQDMNYTVKFCRNQDFSICHFIISWELFNNNRDIERRKQLIKQVSSNSR